MYILTSEDGSQRLIHHGVKGQKWGVRRGPPYPIEDGVLAKGTRVNSVSGDYRDPEAYRKSGRAMYVYNPNDKWDTKVYEGPFSVYLRNSRGKAAVARHQYETVKDLKMPTSAQRMQEFKNIMNDPKFSKSARKEMESVRKELVAYNMEGRADYWRNANLKDPKTAAEWKAAKEIFDHAMETSYAYKSTKEYMKRMSSKYDAMVDDNNVGKYNKAHDPIIIFRANEALKTVGGMKISEIIKDEEIVKNYREVASELAKEGKRPAL